MNKIRDTQYFVVAVNMNTTHRYREYLWFMRDGADTFFAFPDGYKPIPNILYQAILNLRNQGYYRDRVRSLI